MTWYRSCLGPVCIPFVCAQLVALCLQVLMRKYFVYPVSKREPICWVYVLPRPVTELHLMLTSSLHFT